MLALIYLEIEHLTDTAACLSEPLLCTPSEVGEANREHEHLPIM